MTCHRGPDIGGKPTFPPALLTGASAAPDPGGSQAGARCQRNDSAALPAAATASAPAM